MPPLMRFAAIGLLCAAQIATPQSTAPASTPLAADSTTPPPERLLEQSYRMGQQFSDEERCFLLFRLADAAIHLQSQPGTALARNWSEELFRRSFKLPQDWNRMAFQKNALVSLAMVDPVKAFEWFPRMEAPDLSGGKMPPEDLRAFAARTIFLRLWEVKGDKAIAPVRRQARNIGNTGEYPYAAMVPILDKLARKNQTELFEAIVSDALGFYSAGTHVRNANPEFIQLLNANWSYLSPALKRQVLNAAVSNLTRDEKPDSTRAFAGRVVTDAGAASFSNANLQLLYQILPKVREVDPRWAERLSDSFPELGQATGVSKYDSQMTLVNPDGVDPKMAASEGDRALQGQVLAQVEQTAFSDPGEAATLMNSVTDPEFRSEGLSALASAFTATDSAKAEAFLEEARKNERAIKNPRSRLASLVALTRSAASVHNYPAMKEWVDEAFDLGQELVNEDLDVHPGKAVYMAEGVGELSEITMLAVQVNFSDAMVRLNHTRNERLQAYLLIAGAEGLQKLKSAQTRQTQ